MQCLGWRQCLENNLPPLAACPQIALCYTSTLPTLHLVGHPHLTVITPGILDCPVGHWGKVCPLSFLKLCFPFCSISSSLQLHLHV